MTVNPGIEAYNMAFSLLFKKGDRVQFFNKDDSVVVGTVKSINKYGLAKVTQDGGVYEWKIGAAKLQDGPELPMNETESVDGD